MAASLEKQPGLHGYIAMYKNTRKEVWADSSLAARDFAAKLFKARKSYDVSVHLCEHPDGSEVIHIAVN